MDRCPRDKLGSMKSLLSAILMNGCRSARRRLFRRDYKIGSIEIVSPGRGERRPRRRPAAS